MSVEGHQAKDGEDMQAFMNALSPGYFETMGIRFSKAATSRTIDAKQECEGGDRERRFAEHFFRQIRARWDGISARRRPEERRLNIEIIGVVEDALRRSAGGRAAPGLCAELGERRRSVLHPCDARRRAGCSA